MSANPLWPNLAGQHAAYLVKQLEAFKSGARKDPVMSPMAAPLSKQDMENLAAYFASQTPK
jgi:cytochrome c553